MIFSKELQKSDEKPIKLNANVCITVQNVWEHKTCEYDINAWYIENKKQGCNLHTFAYETLFFLMNFFLWLEEWKTGKIRLLGIISELPSPSSDLYPQPKPRAMDKYTFLISFQKSCKPCFLRYKLRMLLFDSEDRLSAYLRHKPLLVDNLLSVPLPNDQQCLRL